MDKKSAKIKKIAAGLEKQFKIESDILNISEIQSKQDFQKHLAKMVKQMMENDFERFLSVMYRMDISEGELKQALNTENTEEVYIKIAALIIEREEEKVYWREKYSS